MENFFFFRSNLNSTMRQILQALNQTKAHILHIRREFSVTCNYVTTRPQWNINNLYTTTHTYSSLPYLYHTPLQRKNNYNNLTNNYKLHRGITRNKSSRSDNSTELSLENVKVQHYLKKLVEEYNADGRVGRGEAPLVLLLDQVSCRNI